MRATDRPESASETLGAALRALRIRHGYSQRDLLRPLHLGSHSAIVDYEACLRVPPDSVLAGYERLFELVPGTLGKLREVVLAERAAADARARRSGLAAGLATQSVASRPRQLPAAPQSFTGRAAELAQLDRLLRDRHTSTPVVISAVSGMGGIGKTALAVHWAYQARENFPDGELYLDMQGYHPSGRPVPPEIAISQFLVALGVAADQLPVTLSEQAALFRTLMADRQMLVLLDNVRDVEQVRPLLPGSPSCRVLITSRSKLPGLAVREGAQRISLDCLDLPDAVRLLRTLIGTSAREQPGATSALANLCGLHPLALRIAAERVVLGDGPVADAVLALSQASGRLGELAVADDEATAIQAVFTWSYAALSKPAQRLFRLFGLHDGPDLGTTAVAALAGRGESECAGLLTVLADAHLVEVAEPGRYRMHDLLRLFAQECVTEQDPPADRSDAAHRLAAWYLASACAAREALDPNLPPLSPPTANLPVPALSFESELTAMTWCDLERANLTATALAANSNGFHDIGWKLPTALFPYYDRRRTFGDWITTHRSAISAAQLAGDGEAEGKVRCNLGSAYRPMRRFDEAAAQYQQALRLFRLVGWRQGEGKALGNLATTEADLGNYAGAVPLGLEALAIFRELDDHYGMALCLANLGNSYSALGRQDRAIEVSREAMAEFESLGDLRGVARCIGNLANVLGRMGKHDEAVPVYADAIRAFGAVGDAHEQATGLADIAESYLELGQREQARRSVAQALAIFTELGEDWRIADLRERFPDLLP